jgi:hypothetical protein
MREWLESIAGPAYATAMMWTIGALLLLLVVLLLIKIVRNLTFGTFVSGGRNRKARLAVMDAAAVDSHRRLVLVRRDEVEHLLLIGGPTDVVVEQNIRLATAQRRPAGEEAGREHQAEERPRAPTVPHQPAAPRTAAEPAMPRPEPAAPRITPIARPPEPAPAATPRPAPTPMSAQAPLRQPAMPAPRPYTATVAPVPSVEKPQTAAPVSVDAAGDAPPDLDEALREELESTLDDSKPRDGDLPESVEDEMSKLLGELSRGKR